MPDTERLIGELKEFKRATLRELESINGEISELDKSVQKLLSFKWKFTGAVTAVVSIVEVIHIFVGR